MQDAKAYCDETGKQLVATNVLPEAVGFYAQLGFMSPGPNQTWIYQPQRTGRVAHDRTCKTCGDPLQGEHGTHCPRCQWSEHDPNVDRDPLSNPSDPFVDLNLGITPRAGGARESLWPFTLPAEPVQTPEEAAQGRMCRFHPERPAVRAEAFAAMCQQCADSYDRTRSMPPPDSTIARVIPSHRHMWLDAVVDL